MKKKDLLFTVILLIVLTLITFVGKAQSALVNTKKLIVKDSIYFDGAWHKTWGGGAAGWNINGNANTNESTAFIGTTDNKIFNFRTNNIARGAIQTDGRLFWNYNALINGIGIGRSTGETTNLMVGSAVGSSTFGSGNNTTLIGSGAGLFNAGGSGLTALGARALRSNTTGSNNTGIGAFAGSYNTTGSNQIFIGNLNRTNYFGDTSATPFVVFENTAGNLNRSKVNGRFQINDGTQAPGNVLTSDAVGVARWAAPAAVPVYIPSRKVPFGNSDNILSYNDNLLFDGSKFFVSNGHDGVYISEYVNDTESGLYYAGTDGMIAVFNAANSQYTYAGGNVQYDVSKSVLTIGGGLNISEVQQFTDNADALDHGLRNGDVYRTGDLLKIVHLDTVVPPFRFP